MVTDLIPQYVKYVEIKLEDNCIFLNYSYYFNKKKIMLDKTVNVGQI